MSDQFALIDARGRAAGAALRSTTSFRAVPDLPTPKRHGWVRPALMAAVAIALVAGLVSLAGRDAAPVDERDPKNLRYVIDDLPDGWSIRSVKDAGVQTGEVPAMGRYAVLFAIPGDPSARAIALWWADPATPEGEEYPPVKFSNLLFTDDVEEFDAAGRRAACGTTSEGSYLCYVQTDQGMVQAVAKHLSLQQVRDALAGLEFVVGHPTISSEALPPGLAIVYSGPEWLSPAVMNPDSAEVASVEYQSSDGTTAFLVVGRAEDHDLAESALQQPWSALRVGNDPGFNAVQGPEPSSRSILWNRDGHTFFLNITGDHSAAMSLANSVRRATDTEWAAASQRGEVLQSDQGVVTTATADSAPVDTAPMPTLDPEVEVIDQRMEMVVTANTPDDVSFGVLIGDEVIEGASVKVIDESFGVRFADGGGFGGSISEAIDVQPIDTSHLGQDLLSTGAVATTGSDLPVTLRVTATNGVRYLVDLIEMPNHPQVRVAVVMLPPGEHVSSADVVDRDGLVLSGF
ncbi:MAG: hypothetical protein HY828_12140 [Actinobacteria bacterium]|nr:hypothetical protein [Actinomycetota bacterium]